MNTRRSFLKQVGAASALTVLFPGRGHAADAWRIGAPIVSYWAGPGFPNGSELDDAAATQLAEGGWNLVWCRERELDVVQRHGLRRLLTADVLTHTSLDHADKHAEMVSVRFDPKVVCKWRITRGQSARPSPTNRAPPTCQRRVTRRLPLRQNPAFPL